MGYTILFRNWRYKHLEIDIIASKEDCLHIIEVKTRSYVAFGEPFTAVTPDKQRKLIKAANHFAGLNGYINEIRFDVVSVVANTKQSNVEILKDAFYALVRKK
jgi:putative endonuclease